MSKSGKKIIASVFRGHRATKRSLCLLLMRWISKYIGLQYNMQNVFLNLCRNSKENIVKQFTRKEKDALVIHPASTLSTERQK